MATTVAALNTQRKVDCLQYGLFYGRLSFSGAGDVYVTGGFDIRKAIRQLSGANDVVAIRFFDELSDGAGATGIATGSAIARYDYATGMVKFYLVGRTSGAPGSAQVAEVEVDNNASLNAGQCDFVAYITRGGASFDH